MIFPIYIDSNLVRIPWFWNGFGIGRFETHPNPRIRFLSMLQHMALSLHFLYL